MRRTARMTVITVGRATFQTGSVQYVAAKTLHTFLEEISALSSWITTKKFEGGYFVQWIGVDDEAEFCLPCNPRNWQS